MYGRKSYKKGQSAANERINMKSLSGLLGNDLLQATRENKRLQGLISQCVPAAAVNHILYARLDNRTLRLTVGSAAWAAKFRFYSATIHRQLDQPSMPIDQVRIHVLPANRQPPMRRQSARARPSASESTTAGICQVANLLEQDELTKFDESDDLAGALRRLADNLSKQ